MVENNIFVWYILKTTFLFIIKYYKSWYIKKFLLKKLSQN